MTCSVVMLQSMVSGSGFGRTSRSCRFPSASSKVMVHRFSGVKSSHELRSWSVRSMPLMKMDWKPHAIDTLQTTSGVSGVDVDVADDVDVDVVHGHGTVMN
jgi:hypothetical protein